MDGATVLGCILIPIYWIPCIVALPPAIVTASAIDYGRASAKVPSLPSDRKLARIAGEVRERMTAAALAERTLQISGTERPVGDGDQYPRLLLRTQSAELSRGGGKTGDLFTIRIDVVARMQPSPGVEWAPTEHRYVIDYEDDHDKFVRDLNYARTALARSIAVAYLPEHARARERILIQAPVSDLGSNVGCRTGIRTGEHVLERVRKTFPSAAPIDATEDPEKYKVLKVKVVKLRRASKGVTVMHVRAELVQSGYSITPPLAKARNSAGLDVQDSCQVVDTLMSAFADDIANWLAMVLKVAPDAAETAAMRPSPQQRF